MQTLLKLPTPLGDCRLVSFAATGSDPSAVAVSWILAVFLSQLYVIFFICLAVSVRRLPERVTTQFGLLGQPRNQMRRVVYVIFMAVFSIWLPLCGLIFLFLEKLKLGSFHVPNQAYWLAPENIARTQGYLLDHWLWFACIMLGFVFGLHYLIIRANRQQPARLPWGLLLGLLVYVAIAVTFWANALTRHFQHTS